MRHFVQYHNTDQFGSYRAAAKHFGIVTDKPVGSLLGDRIWLIIGQDTPRRYFLGETFVVERIDRQRTRPRNSAKSTDGSSFSPLIAIDSEGWFPELKRATGNFAFGLTRLTSRRVITGLSRVGSGSPAKAVRGAPRSLGAGFGTPDENRLVERAAINAVKIAYEHRGWTVESRETLNLGYDLLCVRGHTEHHVEVKGVRGPLCSFLITANERQAAEVDSRFRLCVVLNALDRRRRRIRTYTAAQFRLDFDLQPVNFVAKPRNSAI